MQAKHDHLSLDKNQSYENYQAGHVQHPTLQVELDNFSLTIYM